MKNKVTKILEIVMLCTLAVLLFTGILRTVANWDVLRNNNFQLNELEQHVSAKVNAKKATSVLKIAGKDVTRKTYKLSKGKKAKVSVLVNGQKIKNAGYKPANKKVVSVTKKGMITAKRKGVSKVKVSIKIGGEKMYSWFRVKVVTANSRSNNKQNNDSSNKSSNTPNVSSKDSNTKNDTTDKQTQSSGKTLVAYFSNTGTTKSVAEIIAKNTGADIFEIIPKEPYTDKDLDYNDDNSRTSKEQNDDKARPELGKALVNADQYTRVYLGYPIWWGQAPKIMYTFVEKYSFKGAQIIPFCTSGSSGIGNSAKNLQAAASKDTTWVDGRRFGSGAKEADIVKWVSSVQTKDKNTSNASETAVNSVYAHIGDNKLKIKLEDNSSATAFTELLKKNDVTIDMHDYGSFEKVGSLGSTLPKNDKDITTEAGDVILYQGNQITIYYDTNSWSFTRLGRIQNTSKAELKKILGDGNVTVTFSLK